MGVYHNPRTFLDGPPSPLQVLAGETGLSVCTTALGQSFLCDTEYHSKAVYTLEELTKLIPTGTRRVCITGGEPILYADRGLTKLLDHIKISQGRSHLETSGTLPLPEWLHAEYGTWIACSPKKGFLTTNRRYIDEYKFVVVPGEDSYALADKIETIVGPDNRALVYLQPANDTNAVNQESLHNVLDMLTRNRGWNLSIQLHKILRVR